MPRPTTFATFVGREIGRVVLNFVQLDTCEGANCYEMGVGHAVDESDPQGSGSKLETLVLVGRELLCERLGGRRRRSVRDHLNEILTLRKRHANGGS